MSKDKKYDKDYFESILEACEEECYKRAPNVKSSHRQAFVEACGVFYEAWEASKKAESKDELVKIAAVQEKSMKKCIKTGKKIFDKLDLVGDSDLPENIMKGAILVRATTSGLAEFCQEDKKHGKLIDHLLNDISLMKDMLLNGGAKNGLYGPATKIYVEILSTFGKKDEFTVTNKKIAMAVCLELADPINEFDTKIPVDPIERYLHYRDAFKNGELDPAFPHFSAWEMRHIINSDAKNDQLKWGREMVLNYTPVVTVITAPEKKYLYILETDVLNRNPKWTDSPRTYQQVISGGGRDGPNAWFGRYICKAFGIPTWGCKQPGQQGLTRWTPDGWKACNGTNWDECEWEGVNGIDFKGEVDARASTPPKKYYSKLVLLESLADVMDARRGAIPDDEKQILHPHRTWRSLAIIQKALLLDTSEGIFIREGESPVKTKVEEYLDQFERDMPDDKIEVEDGKIVIPMGACASEYGSVKKVETFGGGKQINFVGAGQIDFDLPDLVEKKRYKLVMDVNTVHLVQGNTYVVADEGTGEPVSIKIPYTQGKWAKTDPVAIELEPDQTLTLKRDKGNLGLAVRKIYLS